MLSSPVEADGPGSGVPYSSFELAAKLEEYCYSPHGILLEYGCFPNAEVLVKLSHATIPFEATGI